MKRPSRDVWAMQMAIVTAKRTTCRRKGVGCVMLNSRGHIIATGYNGVAAGLPHCNEQDYVIDICDECGCELKSSNMCAHCGRVHLDKPKLIYPHTCEGFNVKAGPDRLDSCEAIHAEMNALLQCRDPWQIDTLYVTLSPCVPCIKLLLNTSCQRIVFLEEYKHMPLAKEYWVKTGRLWETQSFPERKESACVRREKST